MSDSIPRGPGEQGNGQGKRRRTSCASWPAAVEEFVAIGDDGDGQVVIAVGVTVI
jgi:hypothetical protein